MSHLYTSTMGAPLNEAECSRIRGAWSQLTGTTPPLDPDPVAMLSHCTDLHAHIYQLRLAINDGWGAANRRAFPDAPKVRREPRPVANQQVCDLLSAGITEADILAAIAKIKGGAP